jgi:hypothetical protein
MPYEEYVKSRNTSANVQGIGTVIIQPGHASQKGKEILIRNIYYIPGFYTNIISASVMREASTFLDLEHNVI